MSKLSELADKVRDKLELQKMWLESETKGSFRSYATPEMRGNTKGKIEALEWMLRELEK